MEYTRNDEKAPVLEIIGGKSGWYRSDPKLLVETIKLDFMDPFDKCSADFEVSAIAKIFTSIKKRSR